MESIKNHHAADTLLESELSESITKQSTLSLCPEPSFNNVANLEIKYDNESNYLKSNGDVKFCYNSITGDVGDESTSHLCPEITDNATIGLPVICADIESSVQLRAAVPDGLEAKDEKIMINSDKTSNDGESIKANYIQAISSDNNDCFERRTNESVSHLKQLNIHDKSSKGNLDHVISIEAVSELDYSKDTAEQHDKYSTINSGSSSNCNENENSRSKLLHLSDNENSRDMVTAASDTILSNNQLTAASLILIAKDSEGSQEVAIENAVFAEAKTFHDTKEPIGHEQPERYELHNHSEHFKEIDLQSDSKQSKLFSLSERPDNLSVSYNENSFICQSNNRTELIDGMRNDEEKDYSFREFGTCITKIGTESITCMPDCTKVTFEAVCMDDSLISVTEDKSDTEVSSSPVTCYMQTMIEGSLQPLNVKKIKNQQIKKDSVLFAAVSEELTKIDSAAESESVEGIVVQSVENVTTISDDYYKGNVHLINLTEPPPVHLEPEILKPDYSSEIEKSDDEKNDLKDSYACNKYDFEKYQNNYCMPAEGKPFLLKILPLKNGHELWSPSDLHLAVAEKGSILLRLCAAPEAGDEDLSEGPQADFSALLLHENLKITNFDNILEKNDTSIIADTPSLFKTCTSNDDDDDFDDGRVFAPPIIIETPKPLLPPSLISRQDFMERLQRPESPHLYEELPLSLKWKVRNAATMPKKRKCHSVPFPSVYRSKISKSNSVSLTPRGRRRGRPPLHNKGFIHKEFHIKKKFMESPIKFRPPTPPSFLFSEESKDSVDTRSLPKKTFDPRALCPSLAGLKKVAPGSILSKQLQAFKVENKKREVCEESVSEASDDIINFDDANNSDSETTTTVSKVTIPCEYCNSIFRKKSALTTHIKMRHRLLRKCPICNEIVRIKGKYGMKSHNLEVHSGVADSLKCELCNESFKRRNHLKNHVRLAHKNAKVSDAENSMESDSEADSKNGEKFVSSLRDNVPKKILDENLKSAHRILKCDIDNDSKLSKGSLKTKDKKATLSVEDSDSSVVTMKGKTRLRSQSNSVSKVQTKIESNLRNKSKEQDVSGESGNESDDEGDDNSGSSESEIEEPKKYFCSQCDEGFSHLFKLKHHHKEAHSSHTKDETASEDEETDEEDDEENDKDFKCKYSCKICDKKCRSAYQLRIHNLQHNATLKQKSMKTKRPALAPELEESVVLRSNKVVEKKNANNTESYTFRSNLRIHKVEELAVSKNMETKAKSPLLIGGDNNVSSKPKVMGDKNRPAYIVRRGRIYCCTKCNINFKREKSMTYHLKKIHETLYPFRACPHCSRVFRSCGPYVRHLSQHSSKRCPVEGCKAKYKILRLIKKHQRHSHPDRPYRCTRCIELFAKEKELQSHVDSKHVDKMKDDEEEEDDDEEEEVEEEEMVNTRKNISSKTLTRSEDEDIKNAVGTRTRQKQPSVEEDHENDKKKGKMTGTKNHKNIQKNKCKTDLEDDDEESDMVDGTILNSTSLTKISKLGTKRKISKVTEDESDYSQEGNVTNAKKSGVNKFPKIIHSERLKNFSSYDNTNKKVLPVKKRIVCKSEQLPSRRSRSLISYKEDDDEEDISSVKNLSLGPATTFEDTSNELTSSQDKCSQSLAVENEEASLESNQSQSLTDKVDIIAPNEILFKASQLSSPNFTVPIIKQKRAYVRKVPYNKKRQEISWTAALKAKYGLSAQSNKVTSSAPGVPTSSVYSPAITADVVRRVAESLLSRHQEQQQKLQQKQQEKLQKKLKKQQKRIKITSPVKYSSASTLPRIPYGSSLNSRDDSLSSFGDSSHTDQLSDYCSSSHSAVNKVPDEDGGPAKVIRFDSF